MNITEYISYLDFVFSKGPNYYTEKKELNLNLNLIKKELEDFEYNNKNN